MVMEAVIEMPMNTFSNGYFPVIMDVAPTAIAKAGFSILSKNFSNPPLSIAQVWIAGRVARRMVERATGNGGSDWDVKRLIMVADHAIGMPR